MSTVSLALAFVPVRSNDKTVETIEDTTTVDSSFLDDIAYYEQVAEEFMAMLPTDKKVIAKLVDSDNHHIIYYETTESPSCYCYDLETQNTSVLFGSEDGFHIGTKLMILGRIEDCRRVGERVVFIATNRAPEAGYADAVRVFELSLADHSLKYIATGADAYFASDTQLVVSQAKLLYRSLFTDEDVYTTAPTVYDL